MAITVAGTCDQAQCPIARNGKCLEAFELDEITFCPHFTAEGEIRENGEPDVDEDALGDDDVSVKLNASSSIVYLRDGLGLTAENASSFMRSTLTRLIIVAGDSDSGKSTLLSCLHERFGRGTYAQYCFAGSRTLPAFEKICHDSRMASGRAKAVTERTKHSEGIRFLHLAVCESTRISPLRHILLSNISGETFDNAKDFAEDTRELDFIRRADHFVLMINGEHISQIAMRSQAAANARMLLRRMTDSGLLGPHSRVDVLISKWDLLSPAEENSNHEDEGYKQIEKFLSKVEVDFQRMFSPKLARLRFFRVAARPAGHDIEEGFGLESVFRSWVEEAAPLENRIKSPLKDESIGYGFGSGRRASWGFVENGKTLVAHAPFSIRKGEAR